MNIDDIVDRATPGRDPLSYSVDDAPAQPARRPSISGGFGEHRPPRPQNASANNTEEGREQETSLPESRTDAANVVWLTCKCGRKMRAKRSLAGKRLKCRKCGAPVVVPSESKSGADERERSRAASISFRKFAEELKTEQPLKPADDREPAGKLSNRQFRRLAKVVARVDRKKSDSLTICKQAIGELAESGDLRALEVLLPLLDDEAAELRTAAAEALGCLKAAQAVPPLVAVLDTGDATFRRTVVKSLGAIGDRRAVRPLIALGMVEPHLKSSIADAVVAIGDAAVPALLELLNDNDPGFALEAVVLLGRVRSPKGVKALVMVLETKSAVFRAHAAEALGQIRDKRAAGPLCRMLQDADAGVRTNAAAALAKLADPSSTKALRAALQDDDPDVQKYAAAALGEIGDRQAAAPLCQLLSAPNDDVRIAAAEALGSLGDERSVQPLLAQLDDKNETVVLKVAGALKKLKDPRAVEALTEILFHPNPAIRQRAADSLGGIGDAVCAEQLETLLKTDRSTEVRVAAAKALGEIGDPASIDTLEEAVHDEFTVRCRAVVALGQIGDEAALPVLLAMLRDPLPEVRYHTAGALAEINHTNAIAPLRELLEKEDDAMVLRGVEKALEKLAESHGGQVGEIKLPTKNKLRPKVSGRKVLSSLIPHQLALFIPQTARGRMIAVSLLAAGPLFYGVFALGSLLTPSDRVVPRGRVASIAFSPDGEVVGVGRTLGLVEFWNSEEGELERKTASDLRHIGRIAFGPDRKTVLLASGAEMRLWKSWGSESSVLEGHQSAVESLIPTPDGTIVASRAGDGTLIFWNMQSGEHAGAIGLQGNGLTTVAVNHDATQTAVGTIKGQLAIFDATGKRLHKYEGPKGAIGAVAFSPDGNQIAAGVANGTVEIWDIETEARVLTLAGEQKSQCLTLQFRADGKTLAAFRDPMVEVWDLDTQEARQFRADGPDKATAAAFSPDGRWLAIGGEENTAVWLFDVGTGEPKHVFDVR